MPDLTITVTGVKAVAGDSGASSPSQGTAGETIAQGMPLYAAAVSGVRKLFKAQATTQEKANCVGISLNSAYADQPVGYLGGGNLDLGAVLTVGVELVVSANAGRICPRSDLASTNWITPLGTPTAANNLALSPQPLEIQVP